LFIFGSPNLEIFSEESKITHVKFEKQGSDLCRNNLGITHYYTTTIISNSVVFSIIILKNLILKLDSEPSILKPEDASSLSHSFSFGLCVYM